MTIYDREYYRREGPSFLGSFARHGQVCKWLILINVAVFVLQTFAVAQTDEFTRHKEPLLTPYLTLNADQLFHGEVWRLVTYGFAHHDLWHILFNMLFLWFCGSELEDLYGPREFLAFYLSAVVLAGLSYVGWEISQDIHASVLGASGAVTAAMVLFACHYPSRQIYIWFLFPLPIWVFVGFQVLSDTYMFVRGVPTTLAFAAHLGGAGFGFAYYKLQWRITNLFGWLPALRLPSLRSQPRLRVYREEE
jgi:membrane associated rhomboid family serine protease